MAVVKPIDWLVKTAVASCILALPGLAAAAGTLISQSGNVTAITAPRPVAWSNFLGLNTDFTDLSNPQLDSAPKSIAYINQELDLMKGLGLNWVREPIHWAALEPKRGNFDFLTSNLQPVYNALQQHGMAIDYYLEGSPCWASGVCAYTGTHTPGQTDTVPPMAHLGDYADALKNLTVNLPKANTWEIWNEENTSGFWQRRSAVKPTGYSAQTVASDYARLFATAVSATPGKQLSLGGFAYTGQMDCKVSSLPACSPNTFFNGYPKDIKRCPAGQTACTFPDLNTYPTNRVTGYGYDLLNGLVLDLPAPPQVAQFHPYVDFEPGMSLAGGNEDYLLAVSTDFTSKLRGEQSVHISSQTGDSSPSAFRSFDVSQLWAGEFGVSSQTYATNEALCNSTDAYARAQCGEQAQATYGIRYIALMSALDVDRAFYFDLSDGDDSGYPATMKSGNVPLHYGLLRVNSITTGTPHTLSSPQPKPLYYVLQRFLRVMGPSLTPASAPAISAGNVQVFCIAWTKPDGHHLLVFWAPDQQEARIGIAIGSHSATLHAIMANTDSTLPAQASGVVTVGAQDAVQVLEW